MLSVVMPGHRIEPHVDLQPPKWRTRVHVPLRSNERAWFKSGAVPIVMQVGHAYMVNTRDQHEIWNDGETPRVHFMFDVVKA